MQLILNYSQRQILSLHINYDKRNNIKIVHFNPLILFRVTGGHRAQDGYTCTGCHRADELSQFWITNHLPNPTTCGSTWRNSTKTQGEHRNSTPPWCPINCNIMPMLKHHMAIVNVKKHFSFIHTVSGVLWLFLSFFSLHGFSESVSLSFRHRSSFTSTGFVHGEEAERSQQQCPTETQCVEAVLSHIFTLLASFHTIATQCHPHGHRNVRAPSPHVWVSWGRICEKRCVKRRCWETECWLPKTTAAKGRTQRVSHSLVMFFCSIWSP